VYLGDVDSDSLKVGGKTVSNTRSLNSSAVQNQTPTLPLVGLSNVGLSIVRVELRDADRWEAVDIDCSVGIDDVGWLGADG